MRLAALLLLLATAVAGASPLGGSSGTGLMRLDGFNRERGAGGFGLALAITVTRPIAGVLDVGLRFSYGKLWLAEIDRTGQLIQIGAMVQREILPRFSVAAGTALTLFSTHPHEQSLSRGLALPLRASYFVARPLRLAVETQPTFFRGGFALTTMLLVEVAR